MCKGSPHARTNWRLSNFANNMIFTTQRHSNILGCGDECIAPHYSLATDLSLRTSNGQRRQNGADAEGA